MKRKAIPLHDRIWDWVLDHPMDVAQWAISVFSLVISGIVLFQQLNTEHHYEENARQTLINSNKLAIYDVDLLINKAKISPDYPITENQLNYQMDSLKQNLAVIKEVEITNLPKTQSMNYQVYRQNFSNIMYKIQDSITQITDISGAKKSNEALKISADDRNTFIQTLRQSQGILKLELKTLKSDGSLYDETYKKPQEILDKAVN